MYEAIYSYMHARIHMYGACAVSLDGLMESGGDGGEGSVDEECDVNVS